jgi:hypothetical protein
MLDLSHIPNSQQDVQIFYSNGVTNAWQTWQKPRKCNYVWIMCVGGAGGGQSGTVASGSFSSNMIQGGGSGAVTRALYNANLLPDILYVQVGLGGTGGASTSTNTSNPGSAGTRSLVALQPAATVTVQNLVARSGNAVAAGGSVNATSTGETVSTQATATFYTLSNFVSTAGVNCVFLTTRPIANINPLTSQITCPGAQGGGGVTLTPVAINGGSFSATAYTPLIQGGLGTLSASTNGGDGDNGVTVWKPFMSTGGAGGGNSDLGNGGKGGDGGIGSGGGGGGSCSSGQSGAGGRGGDGLVVIISF